MKNKILLSTIVVSLLVLPSLALAEEANVETGSSVRVKTATTEVNAEARLKAKADLEIRKKEMGERRESLKSEIEAKREVLKGEIETKRETIKNEVEKRKDNVTAKVQAELNKFARNMIERFEAAIERLEKLSVRIDARIAKMETLNVDVKTAKELMVVAKIKIETAKTSVAWINLESGVIASSTATTTVGMKADFQALKNQLAKAKKDIKIAHSALVDVIVNLKPGQNKLEKENKNATSTATTTATATATTTESGD